MAALIIGAGPAGLTAAYELTQLGIGATVLEAETQVGGLARTIAYRGYRFDIGGHRFFSKIPRINQLWQEWLGDDFLLRPRLSRIYYRGHFFDYPLRPLNALAGLGVLEALRVCLSYGKSRLAPAPQETNFEQWVANRFGRRLYEIFFKTYTEKVWGIPGAEISADWAAQRIRNLSLSEALRHALRPGARGADGAIITTLIDQFHYPRHGPGMMWERCAALLQARGVETRCGLRVERVRHRRGRVESVTARDASGTLTECAVDQLISTMPIRDLLAALDPPPPAAVLHAANGLRYRDYLTVVLIVRQPDVFPDNWIYVHSPDVKLGRVQNYKNWSPAMVPDPTRTALGLEYFLWETDDEWTWTDARLIAAGIEDCARIGLLEPHSVEDGTVLRVTKAYPVYDQAYCEHLTTIRRYLETIANLQLIGRNGQHRYNNQDHSMLAGIYAAHNLAGGHYDVWSVNTDAEYLEAGPAPAAPGGRAVPTRISPSTAPVGGGRDVMVEAVFARLDPVALGAAVGSVAALGLFLAAAVLLFKGGPVVGPHLALLGQYLIGFTMTWKGVGLGLVGAGLGGYAVGDAAARLRNGGLRLYAGLLQRRAAVQARRDLLGRV